MRVLFVTYPENSNVKLIAPLAWAFRAAGHEVQVAGHPESAAFVRAAGLTAVPLGRDHILWSYYDRRPHLAESRRRGEVPIYGRGDAPAEELTWDYLKGHFATVVGLEYRMINDPLLHPLVDYCQTWRPDLVLWESTTVAGAVAAEACGAVHGRLTWSMDFQGRYRRRYAGLLAERPAHDRPDPLGEWLAARAERHGVGFREEMITGLFTVEQLPEEFRSEVDLPLVPMRFVPFNGASDVPEWVWRPLDRRRVCVTLGATVRDRLKIDLVDVPELVEALGEVDAEVVATFAAHRREGLLEKVPPNVRLVDFVPFDTLLPTCSAFVHHGGIGAFSTALAAGTPQVVLPEIHDTPARASRLQALGAGVCLPHESADGDGVIAAIDRVLRDPGLQEEAGRLRGQVMSMPAPSEVAAELVRRVQEGVRA
jgi:glycosyltransferase (activator-dependent family)